MKKTLNQYDLKVLVQYQSFGLRVDSTRYIPSTTQRYMLRVVNKKT